MFEFKDKVAIVTGGGGGIGRAIAVALAKAGAKVTVVDIGRDQGMATVDEIAAAGGEAMFVAADVTQSAQVENYVKETVNAYGRVDIFMNNAGWEGAVKPIPRVPRRDLR